MPSVLPAVLRVRKSVHMSDCGVPRASELKSTYIL